MKIKVLTLNIWGGEFLERVVDFIRKENPDVVLLQEVYNGTGNLDFKYRSLSILSEKLNLPHYAFEPLLIDVRSNDKILWGNAIFSRFTIENQKVIFFDIPFGEFNIENSYIKSPKNQFFPMGMLKTCIRINNKDFDAYNVHGIWGFDGEDSPRRLMMSKTIVDEIKNKEKVILAGDFNVQPYTKTIGNIEEHLQSVFKNELVSTFNMKYKKLSSYATAVVDMIFVSKSITIGNHYMPNVDISDHMPLVCELEI